MSHDKIKAAARRRMAATGEPYAAARRQVISEHNAIQSTSAVSAEDIRAAAAAHRELGSEYSDAVVASFIERVDSAVAARVEARLAEHGAAKPAKLSRLGQRVLTRRVARDALAAGAGALAVVGAVGLHALTSGGAGSAAGGSPAVHVQGGLPPGGRVWQSVLGPGGRHLTVVLPPGAGAPVISGNAGKAKG